MSKYKGMNYLREKLKAKRPRVLTRYKYYDMKNRVNDLTQIAPATFEAYKAVCGWCAKSADSLADRVVFREFRNDNFDMNEIFQMNNKDILPDSAVLSATISSCCFIHITPENGYPRLEVIDGGNATGIIDEFTGMLKEGYAVLERDDYDQPIREAYFTPELTYYYTAGERKPQILKNPAPYPLLVPIIYRPDASRPFGRSRISRSCMYLTKAAMRTLKRSEISAEFYSFPQKYALGTDPDAEPMDKWRATMSSFIEFTKDEDGDKPTVGQFTQASMSPFTEQLRTFASLFSGETGLTLDDLGFPSENPSSVEAIKACHENLRLAARKAQRTFGVGFLNVGYLSVCVRDNFAYSRSQIYLTKPVWEPIFEADAAMLSAIGDGANKINQVVPGYFGKTNLRDITGIDPNEV